MGSIEKKNILGQNLNKHSQKELGMYSAGGRYNSRKLEIPMSDKKEVISDC